MSVEGAEQLKANFAALAAQLGPVVARAAFKAGRLVQSRVIKRIQKPEGVGQWVTRHKPGQAPYQHMASAPGQAPNTDTGELVRGIQVEVRSGDVFVGVESSQDAKANALEFGTTDGKLLPRPFLFPTLEASRREIEQMLAEAVQQQIDGANNRE
jgi:hypothetical protein